MFTVVGKIVPLEIQDFATLRSYIYPHFRQITFTYLIYVKEFLKFPRKVYVRACLYIVEIYLRRQKPVERSAFSF